MIMNVSNSVELMPIFASGRTEFYTLMFYFCASVEEKAWFILLYICTDSQILYRHIYTHVTSKKELICISIMLFSMWLMSALCAGSWHLGTRREVWEDTEEKKEKEASWGKQPMENKHLSANAWCEINVLRFSPRVDHVKLMWWASLYKHRTEQTERLYTPRKAQNDTVFIAARDKSLLFC